MEHTSTETSHHFEDTFDQIPLMLAHMDRDFNFIKVNKAYAAADKKDPDYFPEKNHFRLYPDIVNLEIFKKVVDTGKPYAAHAKPFVFAGNPERGVTYWDWTIMPVKDTDNVVIGLVLMILDVTEQTVASSHI